MLQMGVIGLGVMGESHIQVYNNLPDVRVKAVCDNRPAQAEAVAQRYGAQAYTDFHSLLADPEIRAVSICLPDNLHVEATALALRMGKHVLLEKPLADTSESGKRIAEEAAKHPELVCTVGYNLRYDYRYARLQQEVTSGSIGELIQIYCRRNSPITGALRFAGHSDLYIHVTIHDINLLHWVTGMQPKRVFAKGRSVLLAEQGMTDSLFALITYENGLLACLESAWNLHPHTPGVLDDRMEVIGTRGVIHTEPCGKGIQIVNDSGVKTPDTRHRPILDGRFSGILKEELLDFVLAILQQRPPKTAAAEALDDLYVMEAIARSMREGCEVEVGR